MYVRRGILAAAALLLISGCGSDARSASGVAPNVLVTQVSTTTLAPTTTFAATTTTLAATTTTASTQPATTTSSTTTTTTTTIVAPTTELQTLPAPDAVPTDENAVEPRQELGSIEIPAIGVDKTMFEGVTLTTLNRGPGHWPGTALPGQIGNVVVGGHRVSHDKPFRNLDKLVPGDQVIFTTTEGRFVYDVVSTEIVTPDAIRIIDQTPEKTATLFACNPPGSTKQRIVIHLALATS
jgi:sortase A